MKRTSVVLAVALGCAVALLAAAQQITGAGSTFVYPILSKWSEAYSQKNGTRVNYQSIGSGGGIAQIKAATVDFGASDAPLPPDQLREIGLAQFPLVIGGIVPVVNVEGVQPGQLRFSRPLLADIYLGKIKKWNDAAVTALNPGVQLPDLAITVVHRSDGSGTTFNWVNYLSKVSPEWKEKVGEGTSVAWPAGVGGKGNEGVAQYVVRIKGSIGYVEYAYVLQNNMTYGLVQNAAGNFVKPDATSFQTAAASADWPAALRVSAQSPVRRGCGRPGRDASRAGAAAGARRTARACAGAAAAPGVSLRRPARRNRKRLCGCGWRSRSGSTRSRCSA